MTTEITLPDLIGTERQVAWANDIRAEFLRTVETGGTFGVELKPIARERADWLLSNVTDAAVWIDIRSAQVVQFPQRLKRNNWWQVITMHGQAGRELYRQMIASGIIETTEA